MKTPKLVRLERDRTHRLIPYRYSDRGMPVLNRLAENDGALLSELTELEGATNDRLLGESGRLPGITAVELVSGFRLAHIVNAAFTHSHPRGGRFNRPGRGAWYAAFQIQTSQQEVGFHRALELREIKWMEEEISPYIDYLADFRHDFHDIRGDADFLQCLDPDSYTASQGLGDTLLNSGSAGILYPSVRQRGGVCVGCFRPPLVTNVQEGPMVTLTFVNGEMAAVSVES